MGLDLQLLPFDCDHGRWAYSHTILNCERRRELFEAILALEAQGGHDTSDDFSTYVSREDNSNSHYGVTKTTDYSKHLKWIPAVWLCDLRDHPGVQDNHTNRAVWAYLSELKPDTKVALWWH